MADPAREQEPRGTRDLVSLLFVLGGIPALIAFFLVLFLAVNTCSEMGISIPA